MQWESESFMSAPKFKIGVFGGNFDPFHMGHLGSMRTVQETLSLAKILVVPAFESPLRSWSESSSVEDRVSMAKLGVQGFEPELEVDQREVQRGGTSYTVDTLQSLRKEHPEAHLHLIVGMDQFEKFHLWKDYQAILELADLVVTSRPGVDWPQGLADWPPPLVELVEDLSARQALLKSGGMIHFVQLKDLDISASDIRRRLRSGQSIKGLVPEPVERYIFERELFQGVKKSIGDFAAFTTFCESVLKDKGAIRPETFDLRKKQMPSEFVLVTSGTSTRHASSLAEHVVREVKREYGVWPQSVEGQSEGRWVAVDYGSLILHVFYDFVRQEYRLEDLYLRR
jgi:nicotinate-nucleotide adenylyltransferase